MKLIFSEINLFFSIICSIFVEDKNNWTMINFSKFNSLYSVATYFNTESKCRQAIVTSRWGDDVVCPYCGQHHCNQRRDGRFCCSKCNERYVIDNNDKQTVNIAISEPKKFKTRKI